MADGADFIVLNGDIVDFKWSTLGSIQATIDAAIDWMSCLLRDFPGTHFHYILGNHDALQAFADRLAALAAMYHHFSWHPSHVQIGSALFHHGDLLLHADPGLHWRRKLAVDVSRKSTTANHIYDGIVACRLHHLASFVHPAQRVARQVARALRSSPYPAHTRVTDVYIGHTHSPFSVQEEAGIRIHNSGSSIKHLRFQLIAVTVNEDALEARSA